MNDPIKQGTVNQYKRDLRRGLRNVVVVCAVALAIVGLVTCGPGDAEVEGRALGDVDLVAGDGCGGWRDEVTRVFPGEVGTACRVLLCESGGDERAVSQTGDHGVLQINARTWAHPGHPDPVAHFIGVHWGVVYDGWSNLVMAQKISHHYGWGMWACA